MTSDLDNPRCGNCGQPFSCHRKRMEAPPICAKGGVYRPGTETELKAFYEAAFPDGPQPLATIRFDNPGDMARARAALSPEALVVHLGPNGGGIEAISRILSGEVQQ